MENEVIFTGRFNNRKGHKYDAKMNARHADYQKEGFKQIAAYKSKQVSFNPNKNNPEFTR